MEQVFAVFGDPISHSFSPVIHNAAISALGLSARYHAFKVSSENLGNALSGAHAMGFGGVNLTIPLKEAALKFVEPDPLAGQIGAVNTVDFKNGMKGHNTDGIGARKAVEGAGVSVKDKTVLLLGAGGAARAIAFQFALTGARLLIVNRTGERAQSLAQEVSEIGKAEGFSLTGLKKLIAEADILINSTSVGMYPDTNNTLVKQELMHSNLVVFDIVYNPLHTRLLKEAEASGARIITGEKMLIYQGAEAFRIWTGISPPVDVMNKALLTALGEK
ncbi:MAG: Shikimate dehydrogenase (NADP(+)) [Candidatus Argoarchaeum ethanivorans]|uniref:Shikimate dehydrogenase (NADP(+)) n=1 Tax=Candidatus Argoarchaeum ethanivorans TaxID=2608793 RepID=A0A811ZZ52_9EURY|nr:MAG: Shikimate dehydrogenase (NADP(+)) [Candidatus Argoarchaeum ethanivorans]